MPRRRPALLLPALSLHVLIASGTFLVAKGTLREIPPLPLALFRFVLATSVMWPAVRLARPHKRLARSDLPRIYLLGFLAVPINQGCFLFAMQWASVPHAALLYALTPSFMLVFSMFTGTRPTLPQVAGIALAFSGVLLLLLQRGLHMDPNALPGDLLILGAVAGWAGYLFAGRRLTRRYGPLIVTSESLLAGTLIYLPIGLVSLIGWHPSGVTAAGWAGLAYLALLTSAFNYALLFWGLEYLKPTTVAMVTNLQPLVTATLAWLILHERLSPSFFVSMALVLVGVWLTRWERSQPALAEAAESLESR